MPLLCKQKQLSPFAVLSHAYFAGSGNIGFINSIQNLKPLDLGLLNKPIKICTRNFDQYGF